MKLSLKLREIEMLKGVILRCEPLDNDSYQQWVTTVTALNMDKATTGLELVQRLQASASAVETIKRILQKHLKQVDGLEIEQVDGTIKSTGITVDDMLKVGGLLPALIVSTLDLFYQSTLTGNDRGNSTALPQPGPSATAAPNV